MVVGHALKTHTAGYSGDITALVVNTEVRKIRPIIYVTTCSLPFPHYLTVNLTESLCISNSVYQALFSGHALELGNEANKTEAPAHVLHIIPCPL